MKTRIRILMFMCYHMDVKYYFLILFYSKTKDHKINAFEMWYYRRMLRISWTSHTTNIDVLQQIGEKGTTDKQPEKQKHVLSGPHNEKHIRHYEMYDTLKRTIEGRRQGKRGRGRPGQTVVDDLRDGLEMIQPDKGSSAKERLQ